MRSSDPIVKDSFTARPPRAAALAPFVHLLWCSTRRAAHRFERILPRGRAQLLVNLAEDELRDYPIGTTPQITSSGAGLQGPSASFKVIDTAEQAWVCGVSFHPGGTVAFMDAAPAELVDETAALGDLWGTDGRVLRERLLEAPSAETQLDELERVLLGRLKTTALDRRFAAAGQYLAAGNSVQATCNAVDMSAARFIEMFRNYSGLTPKRYSRLERFQRVLQSVAARPNWAHLAAAYGYADQAHLIRDFRAFAGTTPERYRRIAPEALNHLPLVEEQ